jgi:transposase InsO family protein
MLNESLEDSSSESQSSEELGQVEVEMESEDSGFDESEEGVMFELRYETKIDHAQRVQAQMSNLHNEILSLQNLQEQQKNCPDLGRIIDYLQNYELPRDAKLARQTVAESASYYLDKGLLYHHFTTPNKHMAKIEPIVEQLAIPSSWRTKILHQMHDKGGHFGHDKTYLSLRARYFWPRMYTDCKLYCKTCHICQQTKSATHPEKAEMHPWNPTVVGGVWGIDICGPLPAGKNGEKYILVCVEHVSKWIEGIPICDQEATTVADKLYSEIFTRYMCPAILFSDRGKNFTGKVVARLCKLFAINKINSSAYRPQSNGQVEAQNRVLWAGLRGYCENQKDWPQFLPGILMGYRASIHETTGFSPFQLMYGRNPRLPMDYELPLAINEHSKTADEYMKNFIPKLKLMNKVAADRIRERQEKYKERYDKTATKRDLPEGEIYWLLTPPLTKPGLNKKMQVRYDKLVFIKSKEENDTYRCVEMSTMKEIRHAIHADRLKPYFVDTDYFPERIVNREDDEDKEEEKENDREEDRKAVGSTVVDQRRAKVDEYITLDIEDVEGEEISSESSRDSEGGGVEADAEKSQKWWPVKKLSGTKLMGKKRYYRVVWEKENEKPQWIDEKDIGSKLKIDYHKNYTLQGKKRRKRLTENKGDKDE